MRSSLLFQVWLAACQLAGPGFLPSVSWGNESEGPVAPGRLAVSQGFEVTVAAASPLVEYPMMACLDDEGRLYVAESDGRNLTSKEEIEEERPRFVRRLVDVDGDGVYDESTIFADNMTMPEGGLWLDGALYIVSAPYLWRLEDVDDDGVADRRTRLLGYMEFDGRANQHGPYLGPEGRLYFSGGHFGYDLVGSDGSRTGASRAAGVFSCRPDGSDVRIEGQGGINPVEVVFTAEGDLLSTCAIFDSHGSRHDALVHWMRGGLTQRVYGAPLLADTGYRLPATTLWGQVAPAGLVRYRGAHFGPDYQDTLFACHFNTQRVVHLRIRREGASFVTEESDFLVSTDPDFHPADILEDADGTLLLLDTGGWLSWGCPHSQIAKPQVKGGIYRIRRSNRPIHPDPRGRDLQWKSAVSLLSDSRPAVRDEAARRLVTGGASSLPALATLLREGTPRLRVRAVHILSRLGVPGRERVLREALGDSAASVRRAAAGALGALRDVGAREKLEELLQDEDPGVRSRAAEALGSIGQAESSKALMAALQSDGSLHLRHALVYAVMEIGEDHSVDPYLDPMQPPHLQVMALRILAHLKSAHLTPERVLAYLTSSHVSVRAEARRVIATRPEWEAAVSNLFLDLMTGELLAPEEKELLEQLLVSSAESAAFQSAYLEAWEASGVALSSKLVAVGALGSLDALPEAMERVLQAALPSDVRSLSDEALAVCSKITLSEALAPLVRGIAETPSETRERRVSAYAVLVKNALEIGAEGIAYLGSVLLGGEKSGVLVRLQAARALGSIQIDPQEASLVATLLGALKEASAWESEALVMPFLEMETSSTEERVRLGKALASALSRSAGPPAVNETIWSKLHERFPEVGEPISDRAADRETALTRLLDGLPEGNASRGRTLFFTEAAMCALCHRVGSDGGDLGPNLSRIGEARRRRDLVESIVYPSATVANGFESYVIETDSGRTHGGLVHRETAEAIYVRGLDLKDTRIARSEITALSRSPVSLMPPGLQETLTPQGLADLVAFLEDCRE